jgi:N utilization substance protein A
MSMVSEFVAAVNQICSERGIVAENVFLAIESALLSAYKKEFEKESAENLAVELNRETGKFALIAKKTVVTKVTDADLEISLKDAQKANKKMKLNDVVEIELNDLDFGRIAAQTAKQVIMQKISEAEKQAILDEYSGKIGEIFVALMQRMQRGQVVFEIGKASAFMPQDEQIPNEFYKVGEKYKVLLKEINDNTGGKVLIVSRADAELLIGLFRMEVPELDSGAIEVKACAREAGSRSKMAIVSHQEGIDPIGACVGQRGMRIANVMSELGEEKIDIIEWSDDPEQFIANALSPAKVENVVIYGDTAKVKVAEDQLSLAIGKEGQNVRLAYKLTGYKIDIEGSNTNRKETDTAEVVIAKVVKPKAVKAKAKAIEIEKVVEVPTVDEKALKAKKSEIKKAVKKAKVRVAKELGEEE